MLQISDDADFFEELVALLEGSCRKYFSDKDSNFSLGISCTLGGGERKGIFIVRLRVGVSLFELSKGILIRLHKENNLFLHGGEYVSYYNKRINSS